MRLIPKFAFTATSSVLVAGGLLLAGPGTAAADNQEPDRAEDGCVALASEDSSEKYSEADKEAAEILNGELNDDMAGNMTGHHASCARAVVEATQEHGMDQRAATIAMATVIVETHLNNYTGGDRDSVGLFQQRDHYGSQEERNDPVWTTKAFLDELNFVYPENSWVGESMGEVAQDVQRSAYPDRYHHQVDDAEIIVDHLW